MAHFVHHQAITFGIFCVFWMTQIRQNLALVNMSKSVAQ